MDRIDTMDFLLFLFTLELDWLHRSWQSSWRHEQLPYWIRELTTRQAERRIHIPMEQKRTGKKKQTKKPKNQQSPPEREGNRHQALICVSHASLKGRSDQVEQTKKCSWKYWFRKRKQWRWAVTENLVPGIVLISSLQPMR